jgi:hypothetical protein
MEFGLRPVIELAYEAVPDPSFVWFPLTTGFKAVDQHMPLAIIGEPPSNETTPPLTAVLEVIDVTAAVVTVAPAGTKSISLP